MLVLNISSHFSVKIWTFGTRTLVVFDPNLHLPMQQLVACSHKLGGCKNQDF
jgi:hypothetical protein